MKCHICGKFMRAKDMEGHLKRNHGGFYTLPFSNYVMKNHEKYYGKEKAKYIMSKMFKPRRLK